MAATPQQRKVLGAINADPATPGSAGRKTQYQKLTQLEHVLVRPDTYIGSVERITDTMVVYDEGTGFVTRDISYVPGLYKIFDEILVNAADNKQRDKTMDTIKVTIDQASGTISVLNSGRGIPIEMHAKEKIYIPELIFGHLLTSSNYDDKKKKTTGGRNGYGAKLANIFSTSFIVETADSKSGKVYKQEFTNNMSKGHGKYKIKEGNKADWTKITFKPDLEKFKMTELDDDIVALMTRRVYDIAGICTGVKVSLNGTRLPIKTFKDYVEKILENREGDFPVVHEVINDRWEVCMTVSTNGFQQVSFVNSIATSKGGTHVNYITDQIVKELLPVISKKNKAVTVKNHQIKAHLWVFVNCLIENPTFDSQTKENHTLAASKFGSKASLGTKFMKAVAKTGIVDNILVWAKVKGQELMSKKSGGAKHKRLTGIPKLDDANEAGGRNSRKCTLILTEGDSAKTLALSGLSVIGRDYYGVFPLKGKPLNVREASQKQVMDNQEIKSIVEIMGLQYGKKYDDASLSKLRYGSIMIMADQDQDGSHIKGLLINFVHHFWPELLKIPGFLVEFITPIVKATKGKTEKCFFTLPEYASWAQDQERVKGYKIRYYKGLGTSTPTEAKSYFAKLDQHQLPFAYGGPEDDDAIDMAFSKKKVEARKDWLRNFKPGTFLDHSVDEIPYTDFVNQELILFSMADNVRSIPSMVDGFKPGQRKVLFSCFKRKLVNEIKVAQLAGYVAEHSAYHHGEASLCGTIVGMAQDYCGSNNIPLLCPDGQFGSRIQGGKDAASPRYIFTKLQAITRAIFNIDDDPLLASLEDDGMKIEPEWYMPVIPMVLVNGSDGIGTGWSSKIPTFDPRALAQYLRAMMDDGVPDELTPHFRGFTGTVTKDEKKAGRYNIQGRIEKIDETTLEITELPVREWTQDYKYFLEGLLTGEEGPGAFQSKSKKTEAKEPSIKDYKEYHTDTTVHFKVTLSEEQMAAAEAIGLNKRFKMETSIALSNMVLFDEHGRLKKYGDVHDIMQDFYDVRLEYYQKRKDHLAGKLTEEWSRLDNKVKFILAMISGELDIRNKPKATIIAHLAESGYTAFPKKKKESSGNDNDDDDEDEDSSATSGRDGYDYLLSMPFWSLTLEKVEKLKAERDTKEADLNTLLEKSLKDLWRTDLTTFELHLDALDAATDGTKEASLALAKRAAKSGAGKGAAKRKPAARKKKTVIEVDSDGDEFEMPASESDGDDWAPPSITAGSTAPKRKAAARKPRGGTSANTKPLVRARSPKAKGVEQAPLSPGDASPAPKQARRTKAAAASSTAAAKSKKKASAAAAPKFFFDSDEEDEADSAAPVGLAARLAQMSKTNSKVIAKKMTARVVTSDDDDSDAKDDGGDTIDDAISNAPAPIATATNKAAPRKPKAASARGTAKKTTASTTKASRATKPKATATKAAPKKRAKKIEESDDEFAVDDDGDDVMPPAKPAATSARPSRRAAAAKVTYTFDDASEESEVELLDDGSDFEESDASDFEP
eukprot:m.1029066 g.1029066  ORF g.1029066 m.1029066 type:complete len:1509 (-) comp24112_c0_seq1:111-4637(-)